METNPQRRISLSDRLTERMFVTFKPINYKALLPIWRQGFAGFVFFALLGGCATLNKAECSAANWDLIGYQDAASGHGLEFLGLHQRACARYSVAADATDYRKGYNRGLYDYCVPERGHHLGLKAETHHYGCPADVAESFLAAYISGLQYRRHELARRYNDLDFRYWVLSHRSGPHRHPKHRHGSLRNTLDNLKHERFRVEGLIRYATAVRARSE